MKETKASFTTEKPIDYTQTKDAYDGHLESSVKDVEPLPESERPRKDGPGGE